MTEPTPTEPKRRTVTLGDREVLVEDLDELQYLFLTREAVLLQGGKLTPTETIRRSARIFNTLESAIVNQDDKDHILDLVSTKQMNIHDLVKIIRPEEDGASAPKVRRAPVRRARK